MESMNTEETIEQPESLPEDQKKYTRSSRWDAMCPGCGRYFQNDAKCDRCEMGLINPVAIAKDFMNGIAYGTLVNFFMKAIGAFVVATLPYAILFGILFLAMTR